MKRDYFLDDEEDEDVAPQAAETRGREIHFEDDTPKRISAVVRNGGGSHVLRWIVLTIGAVLGVVAYLRYGTPYVTDATDEVYILSIQREGLIFKTFEGEMVSRRELAGSDRVYSRGLSFSVDDDALGARLQEAKLSGKPLTVVYKRYYGALPWRGASTTFITDIR